MKIKISNWQKKTPIKWRRLGDISIYSLPPLLIAIMASPLSIEIKGWLNFGLTVLLIGLKAFNKLTAENEEIS